MGTDNQRVVIVGAGQAGARTAVGLRKGGWQGEILLIGEEPDPPYERPALSKEVLAKGADPLTGRLYDDGTWTEQGIDLLVDCRVDRLEPERCQLRFSDGSRCTYDRLVLATGARARRLTLPGSDRDGVLTLRTAGDARELQSRLSRPLRVVLIGGGFIGLEVAASLGARGCQVTVLEAAAQLLARVLPARVASAIERLHRRRGVDIRLGARVEAIEGKRTGVEYVRLADGDRLPADLVIVGVGAQPNDELAAAAGLECDDGVVVDDAARSSLPEILAVGDVARQAHSWLGARVRLESWENAEQQPKAAVASLLGGEPPRAGAPWFWTDQYEANLQILGLPQQGCREILRGRPEEDSFCAFYLKGARIVTACLLNAGRERRPVRQLMEERREIAEKDLADPACTLRDIAKGR